MNIVVAFPKLDNAKSIKNILVKGGFSVGAACTSGAQALQYADSYEEGILVCAGRLQDMMYPQLREYLPADFEMLVLAPPGSWEEGMEHVVFLPMPLKVHELISTVEMISCGITRRKRRKRAGPKKRSEEENRIISKAKAVLMERNHMTEEEAHRYIQKISMDSGTGLTETAQMVLAGYDG